MKRLYIILLSLISAIAAYAQTDTLHLNLEQAVARARVRSVAAESALTQLQYAYWQYRTFRAELLPEIILNATLPSYTKRYSTYQNSEGEYSFVRNDKLGMNGGISLSQRIWPTGGTISLSTSFDWIRQLGENASNNFMTVPVAITLSQPIFAANDIKWKRKIEPLRYSEAKAQFMTNTEQVASDAIQYYFNVLIARTDLASAQQNLNNAEKMYKVAQAKRDMGQISENDLLQMEYTFLQARASVASNESTLKSYMFQLLSFLGYDPQTPLVLDEPERLPDFTVDFPQALQYALDNNPFVDSQRRQQLEADYNLARAKGNLRQMNLYAQFGYSGAANTVHNAYSPLRDNQVVEVGVSLPILDWGKRRAAVKVAESNRELVRASLQKSALDFNSNLFILVERFNNQREQLRLADRACEIADKRYLSNVETFIIGRISTLDLNDSQQNKDTARRNQLYQLLQYWTYYYQLRSITLFDFYHNCPIDMDIAVAIDASLHL